MDNTHLNNCINFINKGIEDLKASFVDSDIKRCASRMLYISEDVVTEKDIKLIRKQIIDMIKYKQNELKECKRREKVIDNKY